MTLLDRQVNINIHHASTYMTLFCLQRSPLMLLIARLHYFKTRYSIQSPAFIYIYIFVYFH